MNADEEETWARFEFYGSTIQGLRRLPYWLISNYAHKQQRMGLALEARPVQQGLFFRQKSGDWLPADWWLDTLAIDHSWRVIRCEQLQADLISLMRQQRRVGLRERWRLARIEPENRNAYPRELRRWFSREQLHDAYEANPRWAALEALHYGHLLDA